MGIPASQTCVPSTPTPSIASYGLLPATRYPAPWLPLPPLPWRHRLRISPQPFLGVSCILLQSIQHRIPWRILPIPPAPAFFDECVINVGAIQQEHISKSAPVLVLAVGLEDDIFPED